MFKPHPLLRDRIERTDLVPENCKEIQIKKHGQIANNYPEYEIGLQVYDEYNSLLNFHGRLSGKHTIEIKNPLVTFADMNALKQTIDRIFEYKASIIYIERNKEEIKVELHM